MKKNILKSFIGVAFGLLFIFSAGAEVKLSDKSELVGIWHLYETTPKLDHKRKKTDETWNFKNNGTFKLSATDYRMGSSKMTTTTTYEVANGMLKIQKPGGQPGQRKKYYYYKVYEKNDGKMTLKGGMEGYYFLIKK